MGALLTLATSAFAQSSPALAPNQTLGFGNDRLLTFTYTQQFDCVHQNTDDLNYNGILAQTDPGEFQTNICQAGDNPAISPPGIPTRRIEPIYVLVPMFSTNNDTNPADAIACNAAFPTGTLCGPALGNALISLFGSIPEGFKQSPSVFVQCPDPNSAPGTCTMHADRIDLGKVLVALGKATTATNVFVPSPNHSHIIANDAIKTKDIWWQVLPVLVTNPNDWPPEDGSSGLTSEKRLKAAEQAGDAIEVPSNFFLFFGSMPMAHMGKTQK
jgi:hypothetical protein